MPLTAFSSDARVTMSVSPATAPSVRMLAVWTRPVTCTASALNGTPKLGPRTAGGSGTCSESKMNTPSGRSSST